MTPSQFSNPAQSTASESEFSDSENFARDRAIDEVLRNFDFDSVHRAMVTLNWKWSVPFSATEMGIPNLERIREQARDLLTQVWHDNEPDSLSSIGGFEAGRSEDSLHLEFVLTRGHTVLQSQADLDATKPIESSIYEAAKHLAQTERGQLALQGLRSMMDGSYSLDSRNIAAVMTILTGFYGSSTGTASDAVNDALEGE